MFKGLYIHIPFCSQKCPYCDFFSVTSREIDSETYFRALLEEIKIYSNFYSFSLQTVYFGGGTPSLILPHLYESFFNELGKLLDLSSLKEVTIEVNPESYTVEDFKQLREIGFTRVSVGVQSFLDENLGKLGRNHTSQHSLKILENANKGGFENISVDLIWGLPGQTEEQLRKEFETLKQTPAVHLSAYLLTVYDETPFALLLKEGKLDLPSQERIEALYETLLEETEKLNFKRYEISNFSKREKFKSRHNLLYWKMEPFLGIGAGAWSFDGTKRWANIKNIKLYGEKLLKEKIPPVGDVINLTEKDFKKEAIILGLRTTEGIPLDWVKGRLSEEIIREFFVQKGEKIAFNKRGFLVSNTLLSMLV